METLHSRVAGLDVHKNTVVVCLRIAGSPAQTRTFGTMTDDLLALFDWLTDNRVTHVGMESTGVLWKPVWNVLEGGSWKMLLVNPRDVKQVPGRKSDVNDAEWIAQLLACGLLNSSYVPEQGQRELRDLTRQRAQLASEHTRCVNRIHKVLQDANLKLSSVATDVMGVSGREILAALVAGQNDPAALAGLAHGKLRAKIPQLKRALQGHVTRHHQFMLEQLLDHIAHLEQQLAAFCARSRRGKKRAVIAVGHSLPEVFYHLLADPSLQYHDLGRNYFDTLDPKRLCRHLVKRLESLGYEVPLQPHTAA